jgi:hypothetical protein
MTPRPIYPWGQNTGAQWIWGWVYLRDGLHFLRSKKSLNLTRIRTSNLQASSESLNRMNSVLGLSNKYNNNNNKHFGATRNGAMFARSIYKCHRFSRAKRWVKQSVFLSFCQPPGSRPSVLPAIMSSQSVSLPDIQSATRSASWSSSESVCKVNKNQLLISRS